MYFFGFSILSCLGACVIGCHRADHSGGVVPQPRFEVHNDPIADIWLGELEFVNMFCGTEGTMPSIFSGIFRRSVESDPTAVTEEENMTPEEMNRFKLDHSLLYFRGQAYEWGNGLFLNNFINGTVNRDPVACSSAISWTLQGRSNCTADQALQMAQSYHARYGSYALLTNNCHYFVDRFLQKLRDGHCYLF